MIPKQIPDAEIPEGFRRVSWGDRQPEYHPLPAIVSDSEERTLMRWSLTVEERAAVLGGADLEIVVWTFGGPLQPLALRITGLEFEEPPR